MLICSNSIMTPSLSRSENCYCTGAIKFDGRLNGQSTTDIRWSYSTKPAFSI